MEVNWKPFLLRGPGIPLEGIPKGGTPETRVPARMKAAGEAYGINFSGLCDRYPNTLGAHALLDFALKVSKEKQNEVQEILFRMYFTDGIYPGGANLGDAAREAALDVDAALAYVNDPANLERMATEAAAASRSGVSGVPYFYLNGRPAFSGAQPPETFLRAFAEATR